jgi:hypothetical protein
MADEDLGLPKTCTKCGVTYGAKGWAALQHVGRHEFEADEHGPAEAYEYRNCPCGTTLAIVLGLPRA